MRKKFNLLKCFILIIMSTLFLSGCSIADLLFPEEEIETFGFSGYVYADNSPLCDAIVSCGVGETKTDDRGYYSFSNLTGVVEVSVHKQGYFFDEGTLVYVDKNKDAVNFDGYKYFSINGVVKNGVETVEGASVTAVSKSGIKSSVAVKNGVFYLSDLAGVASISANYEGIDFFTEECNRFTDFVTINSAINFTGKIICDGAVTEEDFVIKLNDEIVKDCLIKNDTNSLNFSLKNVARNSKLKIESDLFYIDNDIITITNEIRNTEIHCEKFYSLNVSVVSGNTILNDAKIFINGNPITDIEYNNTLTLNKMHGENEITANLEGFNFLPQIANKENLNITLLGTFDLKAKILTDDNKLEDIVISVNGINHNITNKELIFENIQLNSNIIVTSTNYHIENSSIIINSLQDIISDNSNNENVITFNLFRYYSLNLSVIYNNNALSETLVTIGTINYNLNTFGELNVDKLFGVNDLRLSYSGYKFDDYVISLTNNEIKAIAKKIFNVSGKVISKDINLSGVELTTQGETVYSNEQGEFEFEDLYDAGTIIASLQNYNVCEVDYAIESEYLTINLTYNVSGKVLCGETGVEGVLIKGDTKTAISEKDGTFLLENLQGNVNLEFEKDYYNFSVQHSTSKYESIIINTTYNIEGFVTDSDNNAISGLEIMLIDKLTYEKESVESDENGKFSFNNLMNTYILSFGSSNLTLKPGAIIITEGGVYNFSNNGYGFSGRIMCGNLPVGDVKLTAGEDIIVYSDANGYYNFPLIKKPTTLKLFKEGYTFNEGNAGVLSINAELDERTDVNFTCSYEISGKVLSLNTPIQNAVVNIGDLLCETNEDGYYFINGIVGNNEISVTLNGYSFIGVNNVSVAGEFNYKAYFTKKYRVVSGTLNVRDVTLKANNKIYNSDENGIIIIDNAEIGIEYTLEKQGYNFENSSLSGFTSEPEIINCSYNILGVVYNGGEAISGVEIFVNNQKILETNDNGEFILNNLYGENELSFNLQNFQFEKILVTEPKQNIEVYAKYSIQGYVRVGGVGLGEVSISIGNEKILTDNEGYFIIDNLTKKETLILEKNGYEFEGNFEVSGPCELNFTATYKISGYVKSGENVIEGVLVTSSFNNLSVVTNVDGFYEIKGQEGIVTLTYSKNGYDTQTSQTISGYKNNQNISLSYKVDINFSGLDNYTGIIIIVNGTRKEYSGENLTLTGLSGFNSISISKLGFAVSIENSPAENVGNYGVDGYIVLNVKFIMSYSARFRVVTDAGFVISDAMVYAGSKLADNLGDGYYSISELNNRVNAYAKLEVKDSSGNDIYTFEKNYGTISSSGTYTITISNNDYVFYLFTRAYQRLREFYAYKIKVDGIVHPNNQLASDQKISMNYKKVGNFRLYENLNYGSGAGNVEPRVSLLTYTDLLNKKVKYQMVNGNKIKENLTADYSTNWLNENFISYKQYEDAFKISAEGFFPYIITSKTIKYATISNLVFSNNEYKFTMQFGSGKNSPAPNDVTSNYKWLMETMVPNQTVDSYNFIKLNFTLDENGDIKSLVVNEQYVVIAKVVITVSVVTDTNTNYYFYKTNRTDVTPIDITSVDGIRRSLDEQLPETTKTLMATIKTYIPNKRRELV